MLRSLFAALLLAGCRTDQVPTDDKNADTGGIAEQDLDGDGYYAGEDCDDEDAAIHPGAIEVCDGLDNDCDGATDEEVTNTWYADDDDDSYGDPGDAVEACGAPAGYVVNGSDCDDGDAGVHPGSVELCDGIDNDCDGLTDEDDAWTWYADSDGDGFGDPDATVEDCAWPEGYVQDDTDCDDARADANPDAPEACDEIDNDCDGLVDEGGTATWYEDRDSDGYGDVGSTDEACDQPTGYTAVPGDCDDEDALVSPAAEEVCNEIDDDCDGDVDEDSASAPTWYTDDDGDGYGDPSSTVTACEQPTGTSADDTDCDDGDADVNPGAAEVCNTVDDDCDGRVDDADPDVDSSTGSTWYADADSDGFGDAASSRRACSEPAGYSADDTDCDDGDADVNPDATEVCNEIDDDCDGRVDGADPDVDSSTGDTWYADDDGDGYGDPTASRFTCDEPSGYTADDTDCDDGDDQVNPGATEICNGVDDDCDRAVDDDDSDLDTTTGDTWYADDDSDGYGDPGATTRACDEPTGYTDDDRDCDDADASVHPGAAETCDGDDEDCDGTADEGVLGSGAACSAESCLEILDDGSSTGDGSYYVDFDGIPTSTLCDMTTDGGGWTLIFSDDFESTPDPDWSMSATYSCSFWSTILGGYGNIAGGEIDITLDIWSVPHSEAWVELEYVALDSWDGETAWVELDGTTVWSQSQNNHSTSYSEVCGWNRGYYGSYDSQWAVSETVTHSAATIELVAGSKLDQASTDESFGLDDVWMWVR